MILRTFCFGLIIFTLIEPAIAFGGCGVGCHATSAGVCVRDGWQEGLPVRNECPATARPTPPCGPYHRWNRQAMTCMAR